LKSFVIAEIPCNFYEDRINSIDELGERERRREKERSFLVAFEQARRREREGCKRSMHSDASTRPHPWCACRPKYSRLASSV